jgi:cytochrome oxidase Cu insertion factor (SCO1/SenC/PrrC family)
VPAGLGEIPRAATAFAGACRTGRDLARSGLRPAAYAAAFGADAARWHLLTGDPKTVLDLAARFGILEQAAGPVQIVHSERLAIVGSDGRIVRFFDDAAWTTHDVLAALRQ